MSFKQKCFNTSEDARFQNFILLLIVLNAVMIGIDTFELNTGLKTAIDIADTIVLYIFIVELLIRLVAHGSKFFNDGWNNFDFVIIIISLAPSSGAFNVFRVFRVFRALRLVSSMPEMQRMVEAMIRSLRGIAAISWLLCIVVYVYSVMGTVLFGSGGEYGETYFGNLGLSAYSLFQIMTLESWSNGIARMIVEEQGWWAAAFFVSFIISTSFTFLNMFIAVFTNTMATVDIEDNDEHGMSKIYNDIMTELNEIKSHLNIHKQSTRARIVRFVLIIRKSCHIHLLQIFSPHYYLKL